jgi:hypothetical protein
LIAFSKSFVYLRYLNRLEKEIALGMLYFPIACSLISTDLKIQDSKFYVSPRQTNTSASYSSRLAKRHKLKGF